MAGAGYKLFNTGDVLTAAQVNTYLMEQSVMVFADAAARTTALTGVVAEGMLSYLKDTNAVEVYNGSAWVASDDPNAIQNTIVDAKGDLISATGNDTPARLAVGTDFGFLQALASTSTGLLWNNAAWTSYTPTITAEIGSFTTTSGEGYYTRVGKMCAIYIRANIISLGTGVGAIQVSIPFTSRGIIEQIGVGRETAVNGKALIAQIAASGNIMSIKYYDNANATVANTRNIISMVYEVA
jgi:hypothetical protein